MDAPVKEIFKSDVVTLKYSEQYKLVYQTWHCSTPLTLDKYKEPFNFLIDNTQLTVYGILSDIRKQSVVGPDMRNWLQKEATPRSAKRGLKWFYIVSEANAFKQYYLNTILKILTGDGIERKIFQDYEKADRSIKEAMSGILN